MAFPIMATPSLFKGLKRRRMIAQGMSAGTAKTPKAVEGEARQPGPKDAPQ